MVNALISQCIRFCHFGFTETFEVIVGCDGDIPLWVLSLCHSVLENMNDLTDFIHFSIMSFFAPLQGMTFSCCLCVSVCFILVSAASGLLSGLTQLHWCCVCPSPPQTIYFPLMGQRLCSYRHLFSQMNHPFNYLTCPRSSFSPQELKCGEMLREAERETSVFLI